MGKPCIAFSMENAIDAWNHIRGNMEIVVNYGDEFEGKFLHTWDAGGRELCRCSLCGGYVLWQNSEFHSTMSDDSYYTNVFPVSGQEEAEEFNRRWDGWEIEDQFPGRYLIQDDNMPPHWSRGETEEQEQEIEDCTGWASTLIGAENVGRRNPVRVIRHDYPVANGQYDTLLNRYKSFFERFLKEQLSLELIDRNLKESELDFRPVKGEDQDYYQRTSGMGLTYIYLRNNLYVEKLTEDELRFLKEHEEYGTEVEKFISETCERVVNPYDKAQMVFFGPENKAFLHSSDEIVLGIRYAEFDTDLENEDFTDNFLKKQTIISRLCLVVNVYGLQKLEKKVSMIQYNEVSIL